MATRKSNHDRNRRQKPQSANSWDALDVSGFGDPRQLAVPATPLPHAVSAPANPGANPWVSLRVDGFALPSPQAHNYYRGMPSFSAAADTPPPPPQPSGYLFVPAVSAEVAVAALRNPANIDYGARQADGSVIITREWVARLVGDGNIERAPSGNLVLARTSEIRHRGLELGLHEGFIRWMTETNPQAAHGAGGNVIQIKNTDADIWFRRNQQSVPPSTSAGETKQAHQE